MILCKGNIWSQEDTGSHLVITTNSVTNDRGFLVAGKGLAGEATKRWPAFRMEAAAAIKRHERNGMYGVVKLADRQGLIISSWAIGWAGVWLFQVKFHWREPAHEMLILNSVAGLTGVALQYPTTRFNLNFPGIGCGGLERDAVLPILKALPDNVNIWELP